METSHNKIKGPVIVISVFTGLIALSAFVPASWFGVQPAPYKREYDLSMLSEELVVADPAKPEVKVAAWQALLQRNYETVVIPEEVRLTPPEEVEVQKHLDDPNNLTASFSKNAYAASAYLQEKNITDEKTQSELMTSLINQEKAKINTKTYTVHDMRVASAESKASLRDYGNTLGTLMNKAALYKLGDPDINDLNSYTNSKDVKYLTAIQIKKTKLAGTIQELLKVSVPPSAVGYHTLAVNKLSEYYTTLDNFSKADTDPLRTSLSIHDYVPNLRSLFGALNATREYFKDKNIVFTQKEPGYVFSSVDITHAAQ